MAAELAHLAPVRAHPIDHVGRGVQDPFGQQQLAAYGELIVGTDGGRFPSEQELQERFNVYVSFLLDGEMAEAHPEFAGKPARIELRCAQMPDPRALELIGMIHDQLAFQEIKLEVVVKGRGD